MIKWGPVQKVCPAKGTLKNSIQPERFTIWRFIHTFPKGEVGDGGKDYNADLSCSPQGSWKSIGFFLLAFKSCFTKKACLSL